MDEGTKQAVLSALRTLLACAGTWLVAKKYIPADSVNEIIGAVMVLIPVAYGAWKHKQAETVAKARDVVAVNAGIAATVAAVNAGTPPTVSAVSARVVRELAPEPIPVDSIKPAAVPAIIEKFSPPAEPAKPKEQP
jgi:hypothetical protein